ncbi:MAG: hypothetical protein H7039_24275 [Bryobacteraceae bacterium]|nr:hypothetical protein [Bryobacteraceae bacterium]
MSNPANQIELQQDAIWFRVFLKLLAGGFGLTGLLLLALGLTLPAPVIDCVTGKPCVGDKALFTIEASDLENRSDQYVRQAIRTGALFFGTVSLLLMAGALFFRPLLTLLSWPVAQAGIAVLFMIVCLMYALLHYAFAAPWYDVAKLQTDPVSVPVFGKRFLFIEVAKAFRLIRPAFTYVQSFVLSQMVASVFAALSLALLFHRRFGYRGILPGSLLFLAWIWPTYAYRNFYDFAIAGFFALGFTAVLAGWPAVYVLTIGIGSLNHENILLLIPVGWLLWRDRTTSKQATLWSVFALAAWFAARVFQTALYPVPSAQFLKIVRNFRFIAERDGGGAVGLFWLSMCVLVTLACLNRGSVFSQKSSLLLLLLILTTFVFGQFNEPRVFIAYLPVFCVLQLEAFKLDDRLTSSSS